MAIAIDRLIHAVHQTKPGGKGGTSPAARNVILAGRKEVRILLDELAYGDQVEVERVGIHEKYLKLMKDQDSSSTKR